MARIKCGMTARSRKKKIFKLTKGYWGKKKNCYRFATAVDRARKYAYRDRKNRKREFRYLWITRISSVVRENGISYSKFIGALKKANIIIDRRTLSELAIKDPSSFLKIVETAKAA
jgi:large subunit ribosomal protein L20